MAPELPHQKCVLLPLKHLSLKVNGFKVN